VFWAGFARPKHPTPRFIEKIPLKGIMDRGYKEIYMERRDFLKLSGLALALAFVRLTPVSNIMHLPAEVGVKEKMYRGTSDGDVLISENVGWTWNLHTRFGLQYAINALSVDAAQNLYALMDYRGHSFWLRRSAGSNFWETV
jgi:hypothetical protein